MYVDSSDMAEGRLDWITFLPSQQTHLSMTFQIQIRDKTWVALLLLLVLAVGAVRVSHGPSGSEVGISGGGGDGCLFGATLFVPGVLRGDELVCPLPHSLVGAVRVCAAAGAGVAGGCVGRQEGFFVGEAPSDVFAEREEAEQGEWLLLGGRALDAANLSCVVAGAPAAAISMSPARALCRVPRSVPPGPRVRVTLGVDLVQSEPVFVAVSPRNRSRSRLLSLAPPQQLLPGDNATLLLAVAEGETQPLHLECAMGARLASPLASAWQSDGRLRMVCAVPRDWQPGPYAAGARVNGAALAQTLPLRVTDFRLAVRSGRPELPVPAAARVLQMVSRAEGWLARIALGSVVAWWLWFGVKRAKFL